MATSLGWKTRPRMLLMVVELLVLLSVEWSSADNASNMKKHRGRAQKFLRAYGYVSASASGDLDDVELSDGLKAVQDFAGLPVTGELDDNTVALLSRARCGRPDHDHNDTGKRKKRYVLSSTKWSNPLSLTYNIVNGPTNATLTTLLTSTAVQTIIASAIKMWTDAACLNITQLATLAANIQIGFYAGDHGDGAPFDGPMGVLAHAFYPTVGWFHFDDSETWTDGTSFGINMLWVAIHELGHILGLGHSTVTSAIMYPYYTGYVPSPALNPDDIAGIQAQYGSPLCLPTTTRPTTTRRRRG